MSLLLCRIKHKSIVVCSFVLLFIFLIYCAISIQVFLDSSPLDANKLNDDYIADWNADDPRLIAHICKHYLNPPSPSNIPYHLENPEQKDFSQKGLMTSLKQLFPKPGFFIESGAFNGETWSNTLALEKYEGWSGLLIEPDRRNFEKVKSKNRKAWLINGCLDGSLKAKKMVFDGVGPFGALHEYNNFFRKFFLHIMKSESQHVWCFPIESLLLAVNQTNVDFFSLDVEGAEMNVIKYTNWKKINVNVLIIEFAICQGIVFDMDTSLKKKEEIRSLMSTYLPTHKEFGVYFHDLVYVR